MGTYKTNLSVIAKNSKNESCEILLSIKNYRLGPSARFKAKIIDATLPVEFDVPSKGTDEDAYPISGVNYSKETIDFGNAELSRQHKHPFFVFPEKSLHFPKDRFFFTFPFDTEGNFRRICLSQPN